MHVNNTLLKNIESHQKSIFKMLDLFLRGETHTSYRSPEEILMKPLSINKLTVVLCIPLDKNLK